MNCGNRIAVCTGGLTPYENLALDEYLLKNCRQGALFRAWRNDPCVVCGSYQNVYQEVRVANACAQGIPVLRRLTGGGAVWHDPGNVNFTFITDLPRGGLDYEALLGGMIAFLRGLGVPAGLGGICDILVDGKKISGSAMAAWGGRLLHHGTLLFDANLSAMSILKREDEGAFSSKAKKSVRSPVVNLKRLPALKNQTVEGFMAQLQAHFCAREIPLAPEALHQVRVLAQDKYQTWAWNYGASPPFAFDKTVKTPAGPARIRYRAEGAVIVWIEVASGSEATKRACQHLVGQRLHPPDLINALTAWGLPEELSAAIAWYMVS